MSFKKMVKEKTSLPAEKLPSGYHIIGDIMLLKMPKLIKAEQIRIAEILLELYPAVKTVAEIYEVSGEYRKPKACIIAGRKSLETVHIEHGIKYKLNVGKIMFSKGNLMERHRLEKIAKHDDIAVDMFAGIGYFSLGIAKKAKRVYAIEKNPVAFGYLKENIRLNGLTNVTPKLGDCRRVRISEKADLIIMGYLPETSLYLNAAFKFIKPKGVIHFHNTYNESELWKKPLSELEKAAGRHGYAVRGILEKREVKSFAPRVYHVVIDAEVEKRC